MGKLFIFDPWPITYKLFFDNDGQQPVGRAIVGIFSTFLKNIYRFPMFVC